MSKLKLHIVLVLALWLAFSGVAAAEQLYVNESGWWRDGGVFNASGTPISAAVGAAAAGDAIYVDSGSYAENVEVNKTRLTLEGADVVTVTAAVSGDHVFEVTADYVNISGFAVRGATDDGMIGIYLDNVDCCNISGNNVYGNYYGIRLRGSSNNTLMNNTANSNSYYGIQLSSSSSSNTLTNNTISNNNYGIHLSSSRNNTANSNNRYDIYLIASSNNTLTNNTANFSNGGNGITLIASSNNTLTNNTANSNKYDGIRLHSSSNNNMLEYNTVNSNSYYGIQLSSSSSNNTLTNNTISNNDGGIYLYNADDNNITCNLVRTNTERGFYLIGGRTGNNISYNNIIENGNYNATTGGWEWQFYIDQYQPVDAKHNYWGAGMNNSTIDVSIYDDEEGGWGAVEFYPFEIEPVQCPLAPYEPPAFTAADAAIALRIAVGSRPPNSRYDVSGDGSVTSLDALMILQAAAGSIEVG